MSPMKKTVTQKTKANIVSATRKRRTPRIAPKSLNGSLTTVENQKEYAEFLIYKELKAEVGEFYPHPGLWLEAPHPMLGGQSPLQLALASPGGKDLVLNLIQMIKAGMFT